MRILVTGGTGLLGKGLVETCPRHDSLLVLHRHRSPVGLSAATELLCDVKDMAGLGRVFGSQQFDVVIHAAGLSSVDYVERHQDEGAESNLSGTANVIEYCNRHNKHVIYISTNAVFDGRCAPYREEDLACPVNAYGRIKLQCEELVIKSARSYSIVRPILMYGWNHSFARQNPVTWLLDKVGRGETVSIVTDVYENPLFYLQMGEALWKVVRRPDLKLVHLAGKEIINRYEFALAVTRVFGLDARLIHPVDSKFFHDLAPRPRNTAFITERMEEELGITPLSVEQGLQWMKGCRRREV